MELLIRKEENLKTSEILSQSILKKKERKCVGQSTVGVWPSYLLIRLVWISHLSGLQSHCSDNARMILKVTQRSSEGFKGGVSGACGHLCLYCLGLLLIIGFASPHSGGALILSCPQEWLLQPWATMATSL